MSSWFLSSGNEVCFECGFEIVVTQGLPDSDYCYYCSNPSCKHHLDKTYLFDTEDYIHVRPRNERDA